MTDLNDLRDEFAKAALAGMCSIEEISEHITEDVVAQMAYDQADAMIEERQRRAELEAERQERHGEGGDA